MLVFSLNLLFIIGLGIGSVATFGAVWLQYKEDDQTGVQCPVPQMNWKPPPPPSRAPSLCPATESLPACASFNGICNRQ